MNINAMLNAVYRSKTLNVSSNINVVTNALNELEEYYQELNNFNCISRKQYNYVNSVKSKVAYATSYLSNIKSCIEFNVKFNDWATEDRLSAIQSTLNDIRVMLSSGVQT